MPTYEFTCPQGHDFEKFYRSIGAAPAEVACPVCGKIAERQLSAGAGLVFKGSGFYITDYGKDGKKDQNAAAAASKSADTTSSDTSSATSASGGESKPANESKPAPESTSKPADAPAPAPKPTPAKSAE